MSYSVCVAWEGPASAFADVGGDRGASTAASASGASAATVRTVAGVDCATRRLLCSRLLRRIP